MTTPADAKRALRKQILRERTGTLTEAAVASAGPDMTAMDERLLGHLTAFVAGRVPAGGTVCAFVPSHGEVGGPHLPQALTDAGLEVLLPVTPAEGPLEWALFTGSDDLRPGRYGIPEPASTTRPPETIAAAGVVILPAVAVDPRGARLGRGAGYYDRSLALAGPDPLLVAVVRAGEIVDDVPTEPHDIRMHAIVTPDGVVRARAD